ncbi:MAG: flagellar hook-associated protein FlgK, partial [Flavobacteriales bacterium]
MIFQGLNIAATSLKTQQRAMDVLSHNIANVNTPGYSRQMPNLMTVQPEFVNGMTLGRGVDVGSVSRSLDPFISQLMANNQAQSGYWDTTSHYLQSIESVFGTLDTAGLNSALDNFFTSWQQLSNNPSGMAERLSVSSSAQTLGNHMSSMGIQLKQAQAQVDLDITQALADANSIMDQIASLNGRLAGDSTVGASSNDLLDQRDQLVQQLNRIIPVQRVNGAGGQFILQSSDGALLVQGVGVNHLVGQGMPGSALQNIAVEGGGVLAFNPGEGTLSALLDMRDTKLQGYVNQLDQLASNLIFSVNAIHTSGAGNVQNRVFNSTGSVPVASMLLSDPNQTIPFADQILNGSFTIYVTDAAGIPVNAGGSPITVDPALMSLNDIAIAISAVPGVTAQVDGTGRLVIDGGANSIAFGGDSSNFLAAIGINTFFSGQSATDIAVNPEIISDPHRIATGTIDTTTSLASQGDNSVASAIFRLQSSSMTLSGSGAMTLAERSENLLIGYGNETAVAV